MFTEWNINEMNPNELKERAREYARFTIEGLGINTTRTTSELEDAFVQHLFHFIFPNLTDRDRMILVSFWYVNQSLAASYRTLGDKNANLPDALRYRTERATRISQKEFLAIKEQITQELWPKLTELQRDFVSQEIFTIQFSD